MLLHVRAVLSAEEVAQANAILARALDAGRRVVTGHRGEGLGVPAQHAVQPVVGWDDVKQPGDSGHLEALGAWRMYSGWPARWYVRGHRESVAPPRIPVRDMV